MVGSDIDLALQFENEKEINGDIENMRHAVKQRKIELLKEISSFLRGTRFREKERVFFCKVPILKLVWEREGKRFEVDLSIGNYQTGRGDAVVGELLKANRKVQDAFALLKLWVSKRFCFPQNEPQAAAFHGLLNSYTWLILYLHFCVRERYIVGYVEYPQPVLQKRCVETPPLSVLFMEFLQFVYELTTIPKLHTFQLAVDGKMHDLGRKHCEAIFVAEPSLPQNNAARAVRKIPYLFLTISLADPKTTERAVKNHFAIFLEPKTTERAVKKRLRISLAENNAASG